MSGETARTRRPAYLKALATLGPRWALERARLLWLNRSGALERRTPVGRWRDLSLEGILRPDLPAERNAYAEWRRAHGAKYFFDGSQAAKLKAAIPESAVAAAESILRGDFPYFGYSVKEGLPPDWNPTAASQSAATAQHWSRIDEFASGDVKLRWELSRFSWVFPLGRAYVRSGDERFAEAFWQLVLSWMEQNPPNAGIQWKCGQEASFRTMALCFGLYVFLDSASTTAERMERFVVLIAALGRRIDAYIEYARSQKNNHGISEGTGLWTIGILFPELKQAARWKQRGRELIELEVQRQIYDDGSYVQHSTNYHRVMLQDLAWALRLGECNSERLSEDTYERFARGTAFLHAMTDPLSGLAPNYGANDGALVLPLSSCAYPDMRPVLQSCSYLAAGKRLLPQGPWDEEMLWLGGADAARAPRADESTRPASQAFESGGYYILRSKESWAMLRGARLKDRPSHADQLHLDLWWRGENVLRDAGTYSYNAPPPFDHGFADTMFHNTVTVDGADQMTRVSRFLWGDWANARVTRREATADSPASIEAGHDGYGRRGVTHRRAVVPWNDDTWLVIDDVAGTGLHTARLHWLGPDVPLDNDSARAVDLRFSAGAARLALFSSASARFGIVRAGELIAGEADNAPDPSRGWQSRYYGRKEPALSIAMESTAQLPIRFVTVIALGSKPAVECDAGATNVLIGDAVFHLPTVGQSPLTVRREP